MNDKGKRFWDNSLNNIDEEHIEEMSETLYKKSLSDFDQNDFVIVEKDKKSKFPIFALVASIIAIIGVATITGVIISNSGIFTAPLDSGNESSIASEIEDDENSDTESDSLTYGDFLYTIETGDTITITRYSADSAEIVIPEEIGGKKVTSIGIGAFSGCEFLTSVTIPGSVTSIGDCAFFDCESLTSVTIPGSVTSIGIRSFYDCESLTSITIPDSVTYINETAFGGCKSLTFINVDSNNKNYCSIDGVLFSKDKTELIYYPAGKTDTSYTIPNSVTSIGGFSFLNCTSLASVTIPNSVTNIGDFAFFGCEAFTSVIIPDSVKSIGEEAFGYCTFLTSVTIPDSVINIGEGAFDGCTSLTAINVGANNQSYCSVDGVVFSKDMSEIIMYPRGKTDTSYTIPDGVTRIDDYTFYGCEFLDSIFISEFVKDIGYVPFSSQDFRLALFRGCPNLTTINVHPDNKNFCSVDGVLFSKDMTRLYCYPMNKADTSYTIPDGVVGIADHAFSGCTALTSVTIPEGVTGIGYNAFQFCTFLTEITIPESVGRICFGAFLYCPLKSVNIPGLYTQIEDQAFNSNVTLTGWPLIKKISMIAPIVIVAALIIFVIVRHIIKSYKQKKKRLNITDAKEKPKKNPRNK